MQPETLEIKIFDRNYSILKTKDVDHLESLAHEVDKKMKQISEKLPEATPREIAILACLNFVDTIISLKEDNKKQWKTIDNEINVLMKEISIKLSTSKKS